MAQTKVALPTARLDTELARRLLTQMQLIRRFEEKAAEMWAAADRRLPPPTDRRRRSGQFGTRPDDYAVSSYRESATASPRARPR
jgi:TPP-dependent pyruvate/acetoin dehydrogenase alpha subunit